MRGVSDGVIWGRLLTLILASSLVVGGVVSATAGDPAAKTSPLFAYRHEKAVSSMTIDPNDDGGEHMSAIMVITLNISLVSPGSACLIGSFCVESSCLGSVCMRSSCWHPCGGSDDSGGVVERCDFLEP